MKIISFTYPESFELAANTYLIIDSSNQCLLVDIGKDDERIVRYINDNKLQLKGILLTHGHFDHIRGVDYILSQFDVPVYLHEQDKELLTNPHLNGSDRFSRKDIIIDALTENIKDGSAIKLLDEPIKVIHTPFHTQGSVCFYLEKERVLFSGDSLFLGSIGRSDFITSNPKLIPSSLAKLMSLNDDVKVYSGHGLETTIGDERKQNPFVKI